MNSQILNHFQHADPVEQLRLVLSVSKYVSNDGFVNLFANLDPMNTNKTSPSNIHFICNQVRAYNGIPGLRESVKEWLAN